MTRLESLLAGPDDQKHFPNRSIFGIQAARAILGLLAVRQACRYVIFFFYAFALGRLNSSFEDTEESLGKVPDFGETILANAVVFVVLLVVSVAGWWKSHTKMVYQVPFWFLVPLFLQTALFTVAIPQPFARVDFMIYCMLDMLAMFLFPYTWGGILSMALLAMAVTIMAIVRLFEEIIVTPFGTLILMWGCGKGFNKLAQKIYNTNQEHQAHTEDQLTILEDLLPSSLATRYLAEADGESDTKCVGISHDESGVFCFTDIKGFTALSEALGVRNLFQVLHKMQDAFDSLGRIQGALKSQTVGDATEFVFGMEYGEGYSEGSEVPSPTPSGELASVSLGVVEAPFAQISHPALHHVEYLPIDGMEDTAEPLLTVLSPTSMGSRGTQRSMGSLNTTTPSRYPSPKGTREVSPRETPKPSSPTPISSALRKHASNAVALGLEVVECTNLLSLRLYESLKEGPSSSKKKYSNLTPSLVQIRVGISSGFCVSGIVGQDMPSLLLLGEGVDSALRLESTGIPSTVHMDAEVADAWVAANPSHASRITPCAEDCRSKMEGYRCCYTTLDACLDVKESAARSKKVEGICNKKIEGNKQMGSLSKMLNSSSKTPSALVQGSVTGTFSHSGGSVISRVSHMSAQTGAGSALSKSPSSFVSAGTYKKKRSMGAADDLNERLVRELMPPAPSHLNPLHPKRIKHWLTFPGVGDGESITVAQATIRKENLRFFVLLFVMHGCLNPIGLNMPEDSRLTLSLAHIALIPVVFIAHLFSIHYARHGRRTMAWLCFCLAVFSGYELSQVADASLFDEDHSPYLGLLNPGIFTCLAASIAGVHWKYIAAQQVVNLAGLVTVTTLATNQRYSPTTFMITIFGRVSLAVLSTIIHKEQSGWGIQLDSSTLHHAQMGVLLARLLPPNMLAKLTKDPGAFVAEKHKCSLLFFEFKGLSVWRDLYGESRALELLSELWTEFDFIAAANNCRPVETVRGEYLLACGAPSPDPESVEKVLAASLAMVRVCRARTASMGVTHLPIAIGISNGPVVLGPLGSVGRHLKFVGPTTNLASRYKSTCPAEVIDETGACIHVSPSVASRAIAAGFSVKQYKNVLMKGRGSQESWVMDA